MLISFSDFREGNSSISLPPFNAMNTHTIATYLLKVPDTMILS